MTSSATEARYAEHVARLRETVNTALAGLVPIPEPAALYDPVRYVLDGGGKRLRPILVLLVAEGFGATAEQALPAALAVEVFHNATLVHDDIMDHAAARRGRMTVHHKWSEADAILAGDYMITLSYHLLARLESTRVNEALHIFHRMATRLCEGQALDKAFETDHEATLEAYQDMIERKTAALLEASLEFGGLVGGATEHERRQLRLVGLHMGRAFQIQDDLLDLTATDSSWGKQIGGDLIEGKKTYLLLRTLQHASGESRAWFRRILRDGGLPPDEVDQARTMMEELGVLKETSEALAHHYREAALGLEAMPHTVAFETLRWLIDRTSARVR